MKQLQALFSVGKREVVLGSGALVALSSGLASAADGEIDTTQVLLYIAGGIVAAGAITAAMLGLVSLIGVGKKTQRAGT
ncbi:hypothetical protein NOX82_16420 [Pseudomonas citronellolis]|uniref:hypothetical protein n=1 Tax=Pseudomonas citronellolis TaxID=53408 RepID=UPI002111CF16|nr:hypothetical protein [Pseudomonas citronellolis]UUC47479.1 hypothetical protein NOX82_16300 [Pseudomonas citronellolis]UUC47490.1 hypothetical protein NOX82_16360 [Pseudomonas citronellolis]UUC47501.1 hypothetical protein NOX82_16420 [Pseudomonas citronellolis]